MTDNRTTELCKLLEERGVEFETHDIITGKAVMWSGSVCNWVALPDEMGLAVAVYKDYLSPEQAIAATLGSEPPYDELLRCLKNDWHISASWDGLRKFWDIELTEEGVKLRDAMHGTLTAEQVREAIEKRFDFDVWVPKERWQAIAEELNAELGSDNEYEAKMDALLCRLTNGKWSKSRAYDLDFMVSCIEEEFEAAELENGTYKRIAELEQLIRNMYHEHPIYYFEQWMEDHGIEVD